MQRGAGGTIVLVTGVDADTAESVALGLGHDLPGAVTVRHRIDPDTQQLTRVVADKTGERERGLVATGHVCIDCALGTDVLPTLDRITRAGRWRTAVVCLPAGTEVARFTTALSRTPALARRLHLSSVVAALDGPTAVEDLLGDSVLPERLRHAGLDDHRGIAEVACAMVEHADVVTVGPGADPSAVNLASALARPDAVVVRETAQLPAGLLTSGRHEPDRTARWACTRRFVDEVAELATPGSPRVWRLDLTSPRPFHPQRLRRELQRLADGRHRARGCFWLPTRPGRVQVWDSAGGWIGMDNAGAWGRRTPRTRLVITGAGAVPDHLPGVFHELLAGPFELALRNWRVAEDGLEPWLGPVEDAA